MSGRLEFDMVTGGRADSKILDCRPAWARGGSRPSTASGSPINALYLTYAWYIPPIWPCRRYGRYTWYIPGIYLVYTSVTVFLDLVYTWIIHGIYLVYTGINLKVLQYIRSGFLPHT